MSAVLARDWRALSVQVRRSCERCLLERQQGALDRRHWRDHPDGRKASDRPGFHLGLVQATGNATHSAGFGLTVSGKIVSWAGPIAFTRTGAKRHVQGREAECGAQVGRERQDRKRLLVVQARVCRALAPSAPAIGRVCDLVRRWLVRYLSEGTPNLRDVANVTASLAQRKPSGLPDPPPTLELAARRRPLARVYASDPAASSTSTARKRAPRHATESMPSLRISSSFTP